MYSHRKEITNYRDWLKYTLPERKYKDYSWIYEKATGMPLFNVDKGYGVVHLRTVKLDQWSLLGLKAEDHYSFNVGNTEIGIPLLKGRNQIGGCLVAFRGRSKQKKLVWRRYSLNEKEGEIPPLAAICDYHTTSPDCLLVDNVSDYLKLVNWFKNTNTIICMLYNPEGIEVLQRNYPKLNLIYDFTAKNYETLTNMKNRKEHKLNAKGIVQFDKSPVHKNRLILMDVMLFNRRNQKL